MINEQGIYHHPKVNNLIGKFLDSSLREIMALLNAEGGSLLLFDPKAKELVLDSYLNSGKEYLVGLRKRVGEGVSGKVLDLKKPVLVKDIHADSRFRYNGFSHYQTNSFISIPLFSTQGPLGILNITDKSTGDPFSEKDLELANTFCKYVCLMADNLLQSALLNEEKENLDKQKNELEKYASVGKLAAGVVHEINNPLDGVIRYTNILLSQMDNNSVVREYLLEVKKGLERIANITKSLLVFAHQANANNQETKKYTDLHKTIEESIETLADKLNGNILIKKNFKASLPKILDLGLQHIFTNIIKNAIDAMPYGGSLDIITDIDDYSVKISFQDTGTGIPSEIHERIFEPFFTTKSMDKGAGLGLSICQEIVNKYEGKIKVQSTPNKGSTFSILLPKKYLKNA